MTPSDDARRIALALGRRRVTADEARRMTAAQRTLAAWGAGVQPVGDAEWAWVVGTLGDWGDVAEAMG